MSQKYSKSWTTSSPCATTVRPAERLCHLEKLVTRMALRSGVGGARCTRYTPQEAPMHPMALLANGVPLTLLLDLALGVDSEEVLRSEDPVPALTA